MKHGIFSGAGHQLELWVVVDQVRARIYGWSDVLLHHSHEYAYSLGFHGHPSFEGAELRRKIDAKIGKPHHALQCIRASRTREQWRKFSERSYFAVGRAGQPLVALAIPIAPNAATHST